MSLEALLIPGLYTRHISFGLQTGDATAPVYVVNPTQGAVGSSYIQVTAEATDSNGPLNFYIVALADGATAPSAAQVIAGTDSTDSAAPKGYGSAATAMPIAATVAGLSASTAYDVFCVATDAFANATTVTKLDITTTAASAYDKQDTARAIASGGARMVRSVVDDVT